MTISAVEAPVFYIGEGRDAKIHERLSKFIVNGVPGWGISEWDYRYINYSKWSARVMEHKDWALVNGITRVRIGL